MLGLVELKGLMKGANRSHFFFYALSHAKTQLAPLAPRLPIASHLRAWAAPG
jgi:hypothetical protein